MTRLTQTDTVAFAGCFVCNGSDAMWTSKNAVGVAARHHDSTGHPTWADQTTTIRYGESGPAQPDMFQQEASL